MSGHGICRFVTCTASGAAARSTVDALTLRGSGFNPAEGDRHVTRDLIVNAVAEKLAGRAAEYLLLHEGSAGAGGSATSDIAQATWIATVAVSAFGLGADGAQPPIWKGLPSVERVPQLLVLDHALAREVEFLMVDGYTAAARLLREHESAVEEIAKALIDREFLTGGEVAGIVARAASRTDGPIPPLCDSRFRESHFSFRTQTARTNTKHQGKHLRGL
jgi:ATP-dependent Zn protease